MSENANGLRPFRKKDFPYFRRLWNSIVVALLAASFLPMLLIGGGMYAYATSILREKTLDALRSDLRSHKEAIDRFLAERTMDLKLLAANLAMESFLEPGGMEAVFGSLHHEAAWFTDLSVMDKDGRHLAYFGPYELLSKNYREAGWFKETMARGIHISDVFPGFRNEPHFVIAVRTEDPEKGPWILRATVDTVYFDDIVSRFARERSGDAFMVNVSGIFQSGLEKSGKPIDKPDLRSLQPFEGVKLEEGRDRIRMVSWLEKVPWALVVDLDRSHIYKPLHRIRNIGFYVFILGAILIVFTVLLTTNYLVHRLETKRKSIRFLDQQLRHSSRMASSMQLSTGFFRDIGERLTGLDIETARLLELTRRDPLLQETVDEIRTGLDRIRAEASESRASIEKFLGFIRSTEPMIREVRLNELLENLIEIFDRELIFNNIRVIRDYQEDMPAVRSDPAQLRQVFLNILFNAMSAIQTDGEIVVTTRSAGEGARVTIRDDGPGIPKENLQKCFDPLFTTKPEGMGLGLPICVDILEKMGGSISLESEPGKGAAFMVEIPVRFNPSGKERPSSSPAAHDQERND